MNEVQSNKARVVEILRAYSEGNLEPLLAALDNNVIWEVHAPPPYYRFGGARAGRDGVLEAAAIVSTEYSVQRYEVKELVGEGSTVWAFSEASHVHSGKPIKFITATRWVFRDGKIIEFHGFFDTAHVLVEQGRLKATG